MSQEINTVICIPEFRLQNVIDAIAALNKTAAKLGCDLIRSEIVGKSHVSIQLVNTSTGLTCWDSGVRVEDMPLTSWSPTGKVIQFYNVRVIGSTPVLPGGWSLCGVLSPVEVEEGEEPRNILKSVPGQQVPVEFVKTIAKCDHCNITRYRKETFVVVSESGEFKSVGRTCLKDFLGGTSPAEVARLAELWMDVEGLMQGGDCDFEGGGGGGGFQAERYTLVHLLEVTSACISKYGWASKASCEYRGGEPTASRVGYVIDPPPFRGSDAEKDRRKWLRERDEILSLIDQPRKDRVALAIEWAKQMDPQESDYLVNLQTCCCMKYITYRELGIACSLLAAYDRFMQRETERKEKMERSNERVGEVDEKIIITVTLDQIRGIDTQFGPSTLHMFLDEKGNSLKWFSSGSGSICDPQQTIRIKGTVKGHDEYKGRHQTMLTHVQELESLLHLSNAMIKRVGWELKPGRKMANGKKFLVTREEMEELRNHENITTAILKRIEKVEF